MSRKIIVGLIASLALMLGACASPPTPIMGVFYLDVTDAAHIDHNGAIGSKTGKACIKSILGVYTTGDSGIKAAAAAGGITKVQSVDYYSHSVLGILADYCTVAYGS